MATVYFTASSLDGFIVDEADSLDWLMSRAIDADGPFGYDAFAKSVGALVMGSATYEWIVANARRLAVRAADVGADPPAADRRRRPPGADVPRRRRRPAPKLVSAAGGKDVWVVGGGDVRGAVRRGGFDRRNDRHLRAVLAGRRRAGAADALGVEAGGVGGQRRLRLRALDPASTSA